MIPVLKRKRGRGKQYHLPHGTLPHMAACGANLTGGEWESVPMERLPTFRDGACWHCKEIERRATRVAEQPKPKPTRRDREREKMAEWNSGAPIKIGDGR